MLPPASHTPGPLLLSKSPRALYMLELFTSVITLIHAIKFFSLKAFLLNWRHEKVTPAYPVRIYRYYQPPDFNP